MAISLGTPPVLPTLDGTLAYPGDWRVIPCAMEIPIHGSLVKVTDVQGFYHLSDGSENGVVGIDAFEGKPVFIPYSQIVGANLQFWVEDAEKHRVARASLARLYLRGLTPVVRIHPIQFHRLMGENKIPANHVYCSVSCMTSHREYGFAYRGELKIPDEGVEIQSARVMML